MLFTSGIHMCMMTDGQQALTVFLRPAFHLVLTSTAFSTISRNEAIPTVVVLERPLMSGARDYTSDVSDIMLNMRLKDEPAGRSWHISSLQDVELL